MENCRQSYNDPIYIIIRPYGTKNNCELERPIKYNLEDKGLPFQITLAMPK